MIIVQHLLQWLNTKKIKKQQQQQQQLNISQKEEVTTTKHQVKEEEELRELWHKVAIGKNKIKPFYKRINKNNFYNVT